LGLCATSCAKKASVFTVVPKNPGIFIPKSDTARDDFIRGVDVSTVIAEEESGVVYKGWDGQPQDLFKTLRESGVNYMICSDGFRHVLTEKELFEELSPKKLTTKADMQKQLRQLIDTVKDREETDNITAALFRPEL